MVGLGLHDHARPSSPWRTTQPTRSRRDLERRGARRRTRRVHAGWPSSSARACASCSRTRGQRGAALGDLRLEPRALGEQRVELVVERAEWPASSSRVSSESDAAGGERRRARARRRSRATARNGTPRADEQVGDVGGGDQLVGRPPPRARSRSKAIAAEHPARRLQAQVERVDGVEQVLLVLLHVLVVGQREAVHDAVERRQVRRRRAAPSRAAARRRRGSSSAA